jgi:Polysaccharide deacetylase.
MKKTVIMCLFLFITFLLISCSQEGKEIMNIYSENEITETQEEPSSTPEPTPIPSPEPTPAQAPETDYAGKKLVALTFDDGPNIYTTPLVLDKLEKYGVTATFFLIGSNISEDTRPVMERQLELGCEIANHSWSHSYMNEMTAEVIKEEIDKTNNLIYDMVKTTPKFFRPPYIAVSKTMYETIDMPFIQGKGCTDWDDSISAQDRAKAILDNAEDGDIILLHDFSGNTNTVIALDDIIQGLLDDGYAFVTVSRLFELKGVDPNVEYKIWTNVNK